MHVARPSIPIGRTVSSLASVSGMGNSEARLGPTSYKPFAVTASRGCQPHGGGAPVDDSFLGGGRAGAWRQSWGSPFERVGSRGRMPPASGGRD